MQDDLRRRQPGNGTSYASSGDSIVRQASSGCGTLFLRRLYVGVVNGAAAVGLDLEIL